MSSIYKQKTSKNWWIKYTENGRTVRKSLKTSLKGIAIDRQKEIDQRLKAGRQGVADGDLAGLKDQYLEHKKGLVSNEHYLDLKSRLKSFLAVTGTKDVSGLDYKAIQDYVGHLTKDHQIGKKTIKARSAQTVKNHINALSNWCEWLYKQGYLIENPARGHELPRRHKTPPRYLDDLEYWQALRVAYRAGIYLQVLTALKTGMRSTEIRQLKWGHIIWRPDGKNLIIANKTKNYEGRTLPLHPGLAKRLYKIKKRSGYVFAGQMGGMIYEDGWKDMLKPLQDAIPKFKADHKGTGTAWHLLRHTFGYRMAAAGVPIPVLKEIMGHKSINTTMIYARVNADVWRDDILKA